MTKEEQEHELSDNRKEQVKNRWEKCQLLTMESIIGVQNGKKLGWERLGMKGIKTSLKERFKRRGEYYMLGMMEKDERQEG